MTGDEVILVKTGGGIAVPEFSTVRVHHRSAQHVSDFDDDSLVIDSSYETAKPLLLRMDRNVLRSEVFEALLGLPVGSAVILPMVTGDGPGSMRVFVELWIADVHDQALAERTTVVSVRTGLAASVREEIEGALRAGKNQPNGVAIRLKIGAEAPMLDIIAHLRSTSAFAAPYMVPASASMTQIGESVVNYILSTDLHSAVLNYVAGLGD